MADALQQIYWTYSLQSYCVLTLWILEFFRSRHLFSQIEQGRSLYQPYLLFGNKNGCRRKHFAPYKHQGSFLEIYCSRSLILHRWGMKNGWNGSNTIGPQCNPRNGPSQNVIVPLGQVDGQLGNYVPSLIWSIILTSACVSMLQWLRCLSR